MTQNSQLWRPRHGVRAMVLAFAPQFSVMEFPLLLEQDAPALACVLLKWVRAIRLFGEEPHPYDGVPVPTGMDIV
jgi:hypothetical protein